jgi:hypothetical protein
MRKEEILSLRQRVLARLADGLAKKRAPVLQPDSRLYPQDLEGELFWIDRLSYPEWPHVGHGDASFPSPGLRYEVWYFQKRDRVLLALLCEARDVLNALMAVLSPLFAAFEKDGKYAGRYRSAARVSDLSSYLPRIGPTDSGIWRDAPLQEEKLTKALETLVTDTYPALAQAMGKADPESRLPERFRDAVSERDPLEELRSRFNAR